MVVEDDSKVARETGGRTVAVALVRRIAEEKERERATKDWRVVAVAVAACGLWRAACGVRRATCGMRRAACGVRRAACGVRRAACGGGMRWRATCGLQRVVVCSGSVQQRAAVSAVCDGLQYGSRL